MSSATFPKERREGSADIDGRMCERCLCCAMRREECSDCDGTGRTIVVGDDCGVLYEDGTRQCSKCSGCGGWWLCRCNDKGEHQEKVT